MGVTKKNSNKGGIMFEYIKVVVIGIFAAGFLISCSGTTDNGLKVKTEGKVLEVAGKVLEVAGLETVDADPAEVKTDEVASDASPVLDNYLDEVLTGKEIVLKVSQKLSTWFLGLNEKRLQYAAVSEVSQIKLRNLVSEVELNLHTEAGFEDGIVLDSEMFRKFFKDSLNEDLERTGLEIAFAENFSAKILASDLRSLFVEEELTLNVKGIDHTGELKDVENASSFKLVLRDLKTIKTAKATK